MEEMVSSLVNTVYNFLVFIFPIGKIFLLFPN